MARSKLNRKSAEGFARGIGEDLREQIDIQFNDLIREVISDLTFGVGGSKGSVTRSVSPVLTGFFASSWKASLSPLTGTEQRKAPWQALLEPKTYKLAPGKKPIVKIRHYIPHKFKFPVDKSVFVGNTAKYTDYALASEKSLFYQYAVNGDLDALINKKFTDRRPNINVAGQDI